MTEEIITIKMDLSDVLDKFLIHIKETSDCLTHIYYAINNSEIDKYRPLPTDCFPILIDDKIPKPTIIELRQNTLNWVLRKAFEDFITGLTKSLQEAYKYLRIYTLSQNKSYFKTRKELEDELKIIESEIEKFHFPDFIERIEKLLNKKLPLRKEILSINQIRNCLVHRHGIIGPKDVRYSRSKDLRLTWLSLSLWTIQEGKHIELNIESRKKGIIITNILPKTTNHERIFQLGDKISFSINEFNGMEYTCVTFVQELFQLIPRPKKNGA